MKLSGDFEFKLIVTGVVICASAYLAWIAYKKFNAAIPKVLKDGLEASYVLGREFGRIVSGPLDAFGVVPANEGTSNQEWFKTTPLDNENDKVSNSDSGINFNLF